MPIDTARQEIETHLRSRKPDGFSVGYDEHNFTATTNSLRIAMRDGEAFQASFGSPGSNIARTVGLAIITIYTEAGKGSSVARGHADTLRSAFINKNLGSVKCGIPYAQNAASEKNTNLFALNLIIPYQQDTFDA